MPGCEFVGDFTHNDGTIDFYLRLRSLLLPVHRVLDLGAGRAAWYTTDQCETRRRIRNFRGEVDQYVAADVDEIVLENPVSDKQVVLEGTLDDYFDDESFDIIFCDYVLEHVEDPYEFKNFINRVLKPGGWFIARTPHKYNYVAIGSKFLTLKENFSALKYLQPQRKSGDIFVAYYRLNTLTKLSLLFNNYSDHSLTYRTEPSYFFGSKAIYNIQRMMHHILPSAFVGNIFVFKQKANLFD